MAKYEIHYQCGCVKNVEIGGKIKTRQERADWMAGQICYVCKAKAEKEEALSKIEVPEMPELEGSEKQASWANSIRDGLIAKAARINEENRNNFLANVAEKVTAKFFIDNRNFIMNFGGNDVATAKVLDLLGIENDLL